MNVDAYCTLGVDREYDLDADALLRAMDQARVDRAVIAPVDRCLAVHNREGNDLMLRSAASHLERFIPACTVNPWYGKAAVAELSRCAGEGARVLVLHPFVQGYTANDELTWPVLAALAGSPMPVYVHTGPPGNATPWQIVDLAERHTSTDFIMGHCGATDFWNDVVGAGGAAVNVYLESSLARPFIFSRYMAELGGEKGIMGSCAPIDDLAFEWDQMRRALPPEEWPGVYGGNLLRLLREGDGG